MKGKEVLFSSVKTSKTSKDNYGTPIKLFNWLSDSVIYKYDLAADDKNHLCDRYFSEQNSALEQGWEDVEYGFLNPPFSLINKFSIKIDEEMTRLDSLYIDLLVPARTDTKWFHRLLKHTTQIAYIQGRLKYIDPDNLVSNSAPFPSIIMTLNAQQGFHAEPISTVSIVQLKNGDFGETTW